MAVDPWPVIATLSRIDQPLTIPSKAARTVVTVGSVPVTLLIPSTSANESGTVDRDAVCKLHEILLKMLYLHHTILDNKLM